MPTNAAPRRRSRKSTVGPFTPPEEAAKAAALRHVSDTRPGIERHRSGETFSYRNPDGSVIRDDAVLSRIKSLAIPPAWTSVWISPLENGHIQATGRDARGRKQYRYHPRWREVRDETKYGRMILFGNSLPLIRTRVAKDLAQAGVPKDRVLAAIVALLEATAIRVGNEEYARSNHSFGLTTLKNRHIEIEGSKMRFRFRGKSGKDHTVKYSDRRLAHLVKQLRDLPGQDLFQFLDDDGSTHPIDSSDVNDYIKRVSEQDFTAKDFRTWSGTRLAASELLASEGFADGASGKSAMIAAIKNVAERLGNTPAVCRKCYIHPVVLGAFEDASAHDRWERAARAGKKIAGLDPDELTLLRFLESAATS